MVDGVVMIEGNGRIYFLNRAAERLSGYSKKVNLVPGVVCERGK